MSEHTPPGWSDQYKAEPGAGQQHTAENVTQPVMGKIEPLPHHRSNTDQQYSHADSLLPGRRALLEEEIAERSCQEERSDGMTTRETVAGE